jgi:hypothetical protein
MNDIFCFLFCNFALNMLEFKRCRQFYELDHIGFIFTLMRTMNRLIFMLQLLKGNVNFG